jgi:hypothetical protein
VSTTPGIKAITLNWIFVLIAVILMVLAAFDLKVSVSLFDLSIASFFASFLFG